MYYDHIDNANLRLAVQLKRVIHNARETYGPDKQNRSLFAGLELASLNPQGNPQVDKLHNLNVIH